MHGAMPLDDDKDGGERYNLIIWMRSSAVRNMRCPMCESVPDIVETMGDGDGFTFDSGGCDDSLTIKDVNVCSLV